MFLGFLNYGNEKKEKKYNNYMGEEKCLNGF